MRSLMQKIASQKFLVLADQAVFSGNSFVLNLALARMLGPERFGVFASLLLFTYLFVSLSGSLVIQPFQVNYTKTSNKSNYINFVIVSQFLLSLFIIFGTSLVVKAIDIEAITFDLINGALLVLAFLMHDFFRKVFLTLQKPFQALIIDTAHLITQTVVVVFLWLSKSGLDQSILFIATAYLPSIIIAATYLKPGFSSPLEWKSFLNTHWKEGRWLTLTAGIQWWSNNLFVVSAGLFLGAQALGALRLVQSLFGVLNILLQAFENYALPQAVKLYQTSLEESKLFIQNLSTKAGIIFAVVLGFLFVFAEQVITLAGGEDFTPYAFVVQGMVGLYAVIFIGYPIRITIRMMVLNKAFFIGYAMAFAFSLLSYQVLLQNWLLWGAIIGLITNQIIMLGYWKYILNKKHLAL